MNGGPPQRVADNASAPDWSPGGTLLAVSSVVQSTANGCCQSEIVDLRSGSVSVIPDSTGTVGPWFGAQDMLIATGSDQSKIVSFDLKARKWTDLIVSPDKVVD